VIVRIREGGVSAWREWPAPCSSESKSRTAIRVG
jgi:hypothetical protein